MRTVIALLAATAALAPAAFAQTPGTLQPGQIERQFQPPPEPRARPEAIQLPGAQQAVPPGADTMRFTAKSIVVEGATQYPAEALRPLIAPLEGREASFAELIALANALTAKYRNDGYILAQVIIPAQKIDPTEATVRLQAVEGYVDAVRFSGELGGDATRLDALAAAIKAARPLTANVLERYLLLMNDIPGLRAATTLTPSPTEAGAADLEIRLVRQPFAGALSIDNRGSRAVGPWRATADLEASGLTGTSRTAAKIVSTGDRELLFGNLQHEQVLNAEGTKLVFSVGAARARPDLNASLGTLTLETESRTLGLSIQHPLIRSRAQNLYARFGFTGYNGETLANGTRTSEDQIRALRMGATWDRADEWFGVNIVDAEVAQGLSGLGATDRDDPNKSRVNGRSDFTKGSLYAARLQSIARRWSVLVA
ncbi:MAG: POTRA domain-containing protein, partial [Burkholderiales bacterium]